MLLVIAIAHLGPEYLSGAHGGTEAAWEVVCYGIEATCLWLWLALHTGLPSRAELAVIAFGAFESIQRPLCRAMLPMDRAPNLPDGVYMCDAAFGIPVSYLSPVLLVAVIAAVVADATKSRTCQS